MARNKETLLKELAGVYQLLGLEFVAADHAERTNADLEAELDKLEAAAARVLEAQEKLKALEDKQDGPAEHIEQLIILRNRASSHAEMIFRQTKKIVNGEVFTQPSLKIEFDEIAHNSSTFCWNSDTMYKVPAHIEEKHGGRQGVLKLIKQWAQTLAVKNPGLYEIIDQDRYALLVKHPFLKEQAAFVLNMAMKDPSNPRNKALIEQIEKLSAEAGKPLVTSHVVPGPVSVG